MVPLVTFDTKCRRDHEMPFAACPSCNQQNHMRPEGKRTLKCSRCGQIYWVKAAIALSGGVAAFTQ